MAAGIAGETYFKIMSHYVQKRALLHAHKRLALLKSLFFHSFRMLVKIPEARRDVDIGR